MTDKRKLPPSFQKDDPSGAVGGVILDMAFAYMIDRVLTDELSRQKIRENPPVPLGFGESILQHTRDVETWATPAPKEELE